MVEIAQLALLPQTNSVTIPESYLDEMGHMNIMYYIHIFDRAAWGLFGQFDLTAEKLQQTQNGMFALKQFIQYLAEVHAGETVIVRSRLLGVSSKRIHFIHFMVNETTDTLASTFEVLGSFMDLSIRRTAPFPEDIRKRLEQTITEHNQLDWEAPLSGILSP